MEKIVNSVQTNPKYAVGDSLTIADLQVMTMFLRPEIDPLFSKGCEAMRESAPKCAAIYDNVVKNPVVQKFIKELKDAETPFTGIGILS